VGWYNCNSFDWPHFFNGSVNATSYAEMLEEYLTLCGPVANLLAFGSLNVRTGSQLFGF
jgi:hypothetical protein